MDFNALETVGGFFETEIVFALQSLFPDAIFMRNIRLYSYALDKETQVDVVMLHKAGIFVIEAKNWKFEIRGEYADLKWKGVSSARKIMTVFNTVDQNFHHIRAMRNAIRRLGFEPPMFHNYVCLPDGTAIFSQCQEVCNLSMMLQRISQDIKNSSQNIQVNALLKCLQSCCLEESNESQTDQ